MEKKPLPNFLPVIVSLDTELTGASGCIARAMIIWLFFILSCDDHTPWDLDRKFSSMWRLVCFV